MACAVRRRLVWGPRHIKDGRQSPVHKHSTASIPVKKQLVVVAPKILLKIHYNITEFR